MRQTLGTAVFSGMLGVTLFGIFLTPVFYYVIQWFSDRRAERKQRHRAEESDDDDGEADSSRNLRVRNGEPSLANAAGNGAVHGHGPMSASLH